MSPEQVLTSKITRAYIYEQAGSVCRALKLPEHEREDIAQELYTMLWERMVQYAPEDRSYAPFLRLAIKQLASLIVQHRKRQKRGHDTKRCSTEVLTNDEQSQRLRDVLTDDDNDRRLGTQTDNEIESLETQEAVQYALRSMPAKLRDVCERVMHSSVAAVAKELGTSRRQVYQLLQRAKPYFEKAGL